MFINQIPMTAKQYQKDATDYWTAGHRHHDALLNGLSEECTEVVTAQREGSWEHLREELGDLLWYVTVLADEHDIDLEDVMRVNIEKLQGRYGKKK